MDDDPKIYTGWKVGLVVVGLVIVVAVGLNLVGVATRDKPGRVPSPAVTTVTP